MALGKNQQIKHQKNGKHGRLEIKWHAWKFYYTQMTCKQTLSETHHSCCNVGKTERLYKPHDGMIKLHTLGALFNMCVLQEEEDVSTFLATWEEAMDDVITADNLIPEDIKIS